MVDMARKGTKVTIKSKLMPLVAFFHVIMVSARPEEAAIVAGTLYHICEVLGRIQKIHPFHHNYRKEL